MLTENSLFIYFLLDLVETLGVWIRVMVDIIIGDFSFYQLAVFDKYVTIYCVSSDYWCNAEGELFSFYEPQLWAQLWDAKGIL